MLVADGPHAQRLLGFTTPHSDFDTIERTAHAWRAREGRCPRSGTGILDLNRST